MDRSDIPTRKLVIRIGLRFLLILALLLFIILFLPPLLNLFFRFMEGEYTARWEQYDRLFARPEPSEDGALYLE